MRLQLIVHRAARLQWAVLLPWAVLLAWVVPIGACGGERVIADPPDVDREVFETDVYPILVRDCGYPACHGDRDRFFRIFSPGRTRLSPTTPLYDPPTLEEVDTSFDRARSMLAAVSDPRQSLLLRKPLEASAGGGAHAGLDELGRNVYASEADPSWRTIARWAGAALEEPDAGPTEDAGPADAGDVGPLDAGPRDADVDADLDAEMVDAP
jgi:hypothetical protein